MTRTGSALFFILALASPLLAGGDLVVRGRQVHPVAGPVIADGVVVLRGGRIAAIGPASTTAVPAGLDVVEAEVVTPGLIDARSVVGLSGMLNQPQDQEQLETSEPIQPELRALDAYDARDPLVAWLRSLGVTTVHTGHAPGALISGQTMIVRTTGLTVEDAVRVPVAAVAASLGDAALADGPGKSPGTRAKAVAMLRTELLRARSWREKTDASEREPDLRLETLSRVLVREIPLIVTAHRHHDILSALRLQREFGFRLILDGASDAHQLIDEIRASGTPVLIHPTMARPFGEQQNASFETAALLADAGIPFAFQSGYESYVPKTRVVLWEAAIAAANGLGPDRALHALTLGAAEILGLGDQFGSLEVGKAADLALFDGDPFEYASHVTGVVIDGSFVSSGR